MDQVPSVALNLVLFPSVAVVYIYAYTEGSCEVGKFAQDACNLVWDVEVGVVSYVLALAGVVACSRYAR